MSKLARSRFESNTKRGVFDGLIERSVPEFVTGMRQNVLQNIIEGKGTQFPYCFSIRSLWDVLRAHDSLAHVPDNNPGLETLHVERFGTRWRKVTDSGHARVGNLRDVG